jgi:hypothetical protein
MTPTPRGWRPSPELAEQLAVIAQETKHCGACDADPGEPCTDPGPGRTVHGTRWVFALIEHKRAIRSAGSVGKGATSTTSPEGPS